MRTRPKFLITVFVMIFAFYGASCARAEVNHDEEKLLKVFTNELSVVKSFEERSYEDYMASQNEIFAKKQKYTNILIKRINEKFADMDAGEKSKYIEKWQRQFQPVVDEIILRTKRLVQRTTATLDAKRMAKIRRLSIEREAISKKLPEEKLVPEFFKIPESVEPELSLGHP